MRTLVLTFLFLGILFHGVAQKDISPRLDSIKPHSPRKAMLLSSFVPGAGQIYNHIAMPSGKKKAFWKVPMIYSGLGLMSYFLIQNQQMQKSLKTEYNRRQNGFAPDIEWQAYDDDALLTFYGMHATRRDLSILGLGLVYLLQIADAGIEAHFVTFDVSDNLSLSICPTLQTAGSPGMKLKLNFN